MATTTLNKNINGAQLIDELKALYTVTSTVPTLTGDQLTVEGDFSHAQLADAVAAHTAIDGYMSPGPERDWRAALKNEIDNLSLALADPTFDWTRSAVIKRLARNQLRILRFIRDHVMDSGT